MSPFKHDPGELWVEVLEDGRTVMLVSPLIVMDSEGNLHEVPAGVTTDFASVPRLFWRMIPPWGRYSIAAVVHDYLYQTGGVSRKEADRIFLSIMKQLNVPFWKRQAMYYAVRIGGWKAWNEHRAKEKENANL